MNYLMVKIMIHKRYNMLTTCLMGTLMWLFFYLWKTLLIDPRTLCNSICMLSGLYRCHIIVSAICNATTILTIFTNIGAIVVTFERPQIHNMVSFILKRNLFHHSVSIDLLWCKWPLCTTKSNIMSNGKQLVHVDIDNITMLLE